MGQNESRFALDYRGEPMRTRLFVAAAACLAAVAAGAGVAGAAPAPSSVALAGGAQESCCRTWITPILTELQHAR